MKFDPQQNDEDDTGMDLNNRPKFKTALSQLLPSMDAPAEPEAEEDDENPFGDDDKMMKNEEQGW